MANLWLPAEWVAQIAGISGPRYTQWTKAGVLRAVGYGRCTEVHALEAAVAARLRDVITGVLQLRIAMDALRPTLIENRWQMREIVDIVWDDSRKLAVWVHSDADIARAVRHGRQVRVIPMHDRLVYVRDEFVRLASQRLGESDEPRLRVVDGGR